MQLTGKGDFFNRNYFKFTLAVSVYLICMLILFACTPTKAKIYPRETLPEKTIPEKNSSQRISPVKTYDETVSEWKSYQDLVKWMERDFSFDMERYKKFEGTLPIPRTPEETLHLKSGIYIDAASFLKKTLNLINPSYKAQIVVIIVRPYAFNHYVCSFKKEGKLFIMDYGTPYREVTGFHGPYNSLLEYKKFYERYHPIKRKIESINYLQ